MEFVSPRIRYGLLLPERNRLACCVVGPQGIKYHYFLIIRNREKFLFSIFVKVASMLLDLQSKKSGLDNKPVVAIQVRKRDRFGGNILLPHTHSAIHSH